MGPPRRGRRHRSWRRGCAAGPRSEKEADQAHDARAECIGASERGKVTDAHAVETEGRQGARPDAGHTNTACPGTRWGRDDVGLVFRAVGRTDEHRPLGPGRTGSPSQDDFRGRYVDAMADETWPLQALVLAPAAGARRDHPGRTVSFLELFYDLVYVAVIAQAAHHLAEHVSVRGLAEFAVVFALIWIAWVNGSLYLELHGREDGRTRNVVFVQMGILVLLAVFTADAAGGSGAAFALVYAAFLAVLTWLWYTVRRQDRQDHPEFLADHRALRDRHGRGGGGDPRQRLPPGRAATRRVGGVRRRLDRGLAAGRRARGSA